MPLYVACNACRRSFDAETHAGLLRCAECEDRMAYRLPSLDPPVVWSDSGVAA